MKGSQENQWRNNKSIVLSARIVRLVLWNGVSSLIREYDRNRSQNCGTACMWALSTHCVKLLELLEKISKLWDFPLELMVLISRTPSQDEKCNHTKALVFRAKKRLKVELKNGRNSTCNMTSHIVIAAMSHFVALSKHQRTYLCVETT